MDGPCSNDNPDYDAGTQPCPGSTTSWGGMFDGAIDPPDAVDVDDYPSFYSCVATSEGGLAAVDDAAAESTTFRFGYEVYTSILPSPDDDDGDGGDGGAAAVGDRLRAVLDDFELRLARGVASKLGLVDGEDGGCIDVDDVVEPEFEVFADVARTNDGGGGRRRGMMMMRRRRRRMDSLGGRLRRRTIATRAVVVEGPSVAGVSSLPEDVADGKSRELVIAENCKQCRGNPSPS